jgi:hypothetical protein
VWTCIVPLLGSWFGDKDKQLVPLGILIVALVLLMSSMRRRKRKPPPVTNHPRPVTAKTVAAAPIRRDMDLLMVELQELSRRISAEIDTRFAKLEAAIRDADRRIAVLNRLSRNAGDRPDDGMKSDFDARHGVVYELADAGFSPIEIARDLGKTPGEIELILNLRKQQTKSSAG